MNNTQNDALNKNNMDELFEKPSTEGLDQVETEDNIPVPKPVAPVNTDSNEEDLLNFSSDDILDLVCSKDSDGYSPSLITVTLQKAHNINENTKLDDITEDDLEYVDELILKNCSVDLFSLTDNIITVKFEFDSVNDAYLMELNQVLNRYRLLQEDNFSKDTDQQILPLLRISFMPEKLKGYGMMSMIFPISYFRVLNDNNINASMLLLFDAENVEFSKIELSEEDKIQIQADVLRETENSTNGMLF